MPLNPFNNCFRATSTKKTPFSALKWEKMPTLALISGFGSGWLVGAPAALF